MCDNVALMLLLLSTSSQDLIPMSGCPIYRYAGLKMLVLKNKTNVISTFELFIFSFSVCVQPLGMERRIISDAQITASSTYNANSHSGKEARLHNGRSWCSATSSQINQWVKVDLEKPLQITGIAIQGDPVYPPNYIKKFKLKYSTDGSLFFFTRDSFHYPKVRFKLFSQFYSFMDKSIS